MNEKNPNDSVRDEQFTMPESTGETNMEKQAEVTDEPIKQETLPENEAAASDEKVPDQEPQSSDPVSADAEGDRDEISHAAEKAEGKKVRTRKRVSASGKGNTLKCRLVRKTTIPCRMMILRT